MGTDILAAPVARPQDLKHRRIERRDGLVNERRILRQQAFLLLNNRQMPVEFTGLLKGPARAKAECNVVDQRSLLCLVAVNFQAEHAKAGIVEASPNHFKGSEFFGDKENRLASRQRCRDQIRDGLRLASARRTFDNQIPSSKCVHERAVLRTVGIPNEVRHILHQFGFVNRVLFRKFDIGILGALE